MQNPLQKNMVDREVGNLANWLLEQESHRALQWLQEVLAGRRPIPVDFGWQDLAECAASDTNPNRETHLLLMKTGYMWQHSPILI